MMEHTDRHRKKEEEDEEEEIVSQHSQPFNRSDDTH